MGLGQLTTRIAMEKIIEIIKDYYEGRIGLDDASFNLVDEVPVEQLSDFIMDAFSRGWITPFNLGFTD
jgi:hypothetical protein